MEKINISKKTLLTLYDSGQSMADIATSLHCSLHKVTYWMTKYNIKKRSRSDAMYIKLNPTGDPFHIKADLSYNETTLYGLGLGIYWGEGDKTSNHSVRVTNTDPVLLRTFIKFLVVICQLRPDRIHYSIVCFNDSDPNTARIFWAKELATNEDKFGKIVQIPSQGKGIYKRKSKYGVCSVTGSSTKLKTWIMGEIKKLPG